jgi:hypothetical protein
MGERSFENILPRINRIILALETKIQSIAREIEEENRTNNINLTGLVFIAALNHNINIGDLEYLKDIKLKIEMSQGNPGIPIGDIFIPATRNLGEGEPPANHVPRRVADIVNELEIKYVALVANLPTIGGKYKKYRNTRKVKKYKR